MEQNLKIRRVRDPIHDLITFDPRDDLDMLAWNLINAREFQRLRRVRQLGFSELVFPGATHTRFSHCLGAYFIARKLLGTISKATQFNKEKAFIAAIASLVHDLGHGPFSHVFENVQKDLGKHRRHEDWTRQIVEDDTEIHELLQRNDDSLAHAVGLLFSRKDPTDVYDSVVSSQFDADRLDYLQRDRYMTGTRTGGFDFSWLLDCLDIGRINIGQADEYVEVDGLYINYKGLAAAEGYVLARFHLYSQVYLHKTTRAAERMLAALLVRVGELFKAGSGDASGLSPQHTLARFFQQDKSDLRTYLDLDDIAIWSGLIEMVEARDETTRTLAARLRDRKLYKCLDVGELAKRHGSDSVPHFKRRLQERTSDLGVSVLKDEAWLTPYGVHEYEDPAAFQKVLIGRADGSGKTDDIAERSAIVESIKRQRIFRIYCCDSDSLRAMESLLGEVLK